MVSRRSSALASPRLRSARRSAATKLRTTRHRPVSAVSRLNRPCAVRISSGIPFGNEMPRASRDHRPSVMATVTASQQAAPRRFERTAAARGMTKNQMKLGSRKPPDTAFMYTSSTLRIASARCPQSEARPVRRNRKRLAMPAAIATSSARHTPHIPRRQYWWTDSTPIAHRASVARWMTRIRRTRSSSPRSVSSAGRTAAAPSMSRESPWDTMTASTSSGSRGMS